MRRTLDWDTEELGLVPGGRTSSMLFRISYLFPARSPMLAPVLLLGIEMEAFLEEVKLHI